MFRAEGSTSRAAGRTAGFSLLELVVAMAITSLALLLVSGLLLEADSRMRRQTDENLRPVVPVALRQLRTDIRTSVRARAPIFGGWEREPMILEGHPAGLLEYGRADDRLVRRTYDPLTGRLLGERLLLDSLRSFRWRVIGQMVQAEIRVSRVPRLRSIRRSWALSPASQSPDELRVVWAHPRAGGAVAW